jgi:hypothetical protein
MDKIWNYCEVEFLLDLFNGPIPSDFDSDKEAWSSLFKLFHSKSELLVDSKSRLLDGVDNPYVKHLIKQSNSGGSRIHEVPSIFEEIREDFSFIKTGSNSESPLYFFANEPPEDKGYGVVISHPAKKYETIKRVALDTFSISVSKNKASNQLTDWADLFRDLPPRNSLIIADNWLLTDNAMDKNLFAILKHCIPQKLEKTFHLLIIAKPDLLNYDKKCQEIRRFVDSMAADIDLTIIQAEYHSRAIVSNYFYIQSDHSFNFFNNINQVKKNALVTYKPICCEEDSNWFQSKLIELKNTVERGNNRFGSAVFPLLKNL